MWRSQSSGGMRRRRSLVRCCHWLMTRSCICVFVQDFIREAPVIDAVVAYFLETLCVAKATALSDCAARTDCVQSISARSTRCLCVCFRSCDTGLRGTSAIAATMGGGDSERLLRQWVALKNIRCRI